MADGVREAVHRIVETTTREVTRGQKEGVCVLSKDRATKICLEAKNDIVPEAVREALTKGVLENGCKIFFPNEARRYDCCRILKGNTCWAIGTITNHSHNSKLLFITLEIPLGPLKGLDP